MRAVLLSLYNVSDSFLTSLLNRRLSSRPQNFPRTSTRDSTQKNSILLTQLYRDPCSVSDWLLLARENSKQATSNQRHYATTTTSNNLFVPHLQPTRAYFGISRNSVTSQTELRIPSYFTLRSSVTPSGTLIVVIFKSCLVR